MTYTVITIGADWSRHAVRICASCATAAIAIALRDPCVASAYIVEDIR